MAILQKIEYDDPKACEDVLEAEVITPVIEAEATTVVLPEAEPTPATADVVHNANMVGLGFPKWEKAFGEW